LKAPGGFGINNHDVFHARKHIRLKESPLEMICDRSFEAFTYLAFKSIEPQTPFLNNWHFGLLCEYMQAAAKKQIKRLIINIPPRYIKSTICSVSFPAWILKENPSNKIIVGSCDRDLAGTHHINTRVVMNSEWYKRKFPEVQFSKDQNTTRKFKTTEGGHRIGVSMGQNILGEGCNYLIIDDPHKPKNGNLEKALLNAQIWFEQQAYSRLNDKKNDVIVLIMQRIHENDLSQYLLNKGGWEHCKIPGIEPARKIYSFGDFSYERQAGEVLHEARESLEDLEKSKVSMGSYAFEAQYQQNPAPVGGGVFKLKWFGRFSEEPAEPEFTIQSWDTAVKTGDKHDYSVCTTWKVFKSKYYLVDVNRARLEYPDLKKRAINMANNFQPDMILLEDKASGQALIQDLKRETKLPVIAINPTKDKNTRANAQSGKIEAGLVFLPTYAPWLPDFENELTAFPNGNFDDQIDSVTQFLEYITNKMQTSSANIRVL